MNPACTQEPGLRASARHAGLRHRGGVLVCGAATALAMALVPHIASARDQDVIPFQPGDPTVNGCPSGWEALLTSDLTPLGYQLPSKLDSLAWGGNNDGVVCGQPFTPQEQAARVPADIVVPVIFNFRDNNLPASR